jgi:aminoglycoside 2'-N-acetyltransferase I
MAINIRLEKALTDEEHFALFGWGENIFGVEDKRFSWRPKDWHFIVEEEGHVLSHVGVMETSVRVGETDIKVGGIGGVVSVPEAQGRGNIHAAMSRAAEFMGDQLRVEFGMLFCLPRLVPFYARQNWQLLNDAVEFEQPSGKVVSPFHSMVLPFDNRAWPEGEVKVGGLPW